MTSTRRPPAGTPLTHRERQVLRQAANGLTDEAIARHLGLSFSTIKTHLRRIYSKLDAQGRTHAVALAYERGILLPASVPRPSDVSAPEGR
ncbi:helix-turn-helix transcriptional regulator [Allokutzneria sp. A3M-2-11 16]|uniref:response regulator transcription factor n=1 Tax=Allokutzneria sp. A3M-2-11 16 TaxID=2962043 RepID=UPI0020B72647|nr:helix-turn-helix transcriptional regulator [Allokutzneria sp. A3M-2-11 16]MCP3805402.1 helix-turn-helix transcriptional regulator [Allokutzneria sp. A3M-2-11 16]